MLERLEDQITEIYEWRSSESS